MSEPTTVPVERERGHGAGPARGALAPALAVLAAFGASLCCVGPILFVTLGVGVGLASTFEPLRPLFTVLMIVALGIGFYTAYGRATDVGACAPGEACARPRSRRREKFVLWGATMLAMLFWSFNYWSILLV